jgi:ferric-dicitrate binding protein FerR (iron transport regulator)
MNDFVRDLEAELISAAHRRARAVQRRRRQIRPPALLTAALVAVAILAFALAPRGAVEDASSAFAVAGTCNFPDATLLLRDAPCTSNPFGQ